jgi:hypothetical protein
MQKDMKDVEPLITAMSKSEDWCLSQALVTIDSFTEPKSFEMEITAKESKYTQIRPGERVVISGVPAGKAYYSLYAQSMKLQSSADLDVIFPLVTDKLFVEREGIFVY